MWLGELITDRGVGNGMSLLIFTSIAAGFPTSLWQIKIERGWGLFLVVVAAGLVIIALVVFVEQAQRRIPVQYAKRMIGRRQYGGSSTYIPLKVNQAGVIPVIFASSLLYLPALAINLTDRNNPPGWATWIQQYLVSGDHPIYMLTYFGLIVFFTYFYVAITFNPTEVADNMKKYGGFIPGIRAGQPDRGVPRLRALPDHPAGCALSRRDLAHPAHRPGAVQRQPELPVRRNSHPHHRRRRTRDGQTDREPAAAA